MKRLLPQRFRAVVEILLHVPGATQPACVLVAAAPADDHAPTLPGEGARHGLADAAGGAGDKDDAVVVLLLHTAKESCAAAFESNCAFNNLPLTSLRGIVHSTPPPDVIARDRAFNTPPDVIARDRAFNDPEAIFDLSLPGN